MAYIGKEICHRLKLIRYKIAQACDIDYTPEICNFEGECSGTCPLCEAELGYLQHLIDLKDPLIYEKIQGLAIEPKMVNDIKDINYSEPKEFDEEIFL